MADDTGASPAGVSPAQPRQMAWVAVAGMVCLLLMALASLSLFALLGKQQQVPITITNASNNREEKAAPPPAPPAAPTPVNRPHDPGAERGSRMSGQIKGQESPLPGGANAGRGHREGAAIRADTQTPPYEVKGGPANFAGMRLRFTPDKPDKLKGPVPFRVSQFQIGPDGRAAGVLARIPGPGQEADFSFLPDVSYLPAAAQGGGMGIAISSPRKTSVVNGLRAPKGFQFFVGELRVSNLGTEALALNPDYFEVRDRDRVAYLANPELLGASFPSDALQAGAEATFMSAFLIPSDAALDALVAAEPGGKLVSAPLALK